MLLKLGASSQRLSLEYGLVCWASRCPSCADTPEASSGLTTPSVWACRVLPGSSSRADPGRHSHLSPTAAWQERAFPSFPKAHTPVFSDRVPCGESAPRVLSEQLSEQRTEGASEEVTGGQGEPSPGAWPCHLEGICPFQGKSRYGLPV